MRFFDCSLMYGRMLTPPLRHSITTAQLVAEMDFCGVDEGLVLAAASVHESPLVGNELVLQDTADEPRLHPTWALLPAQTGERPPGEAFLAQMRAAGVRALHAFPELHNYRLDRLTFGDLLPLLVENRVPLFVRKYDWQKVVDLLSAYPQLTLIQTAIGSWGFDRQVRPLVEAFPNFYFEISNYENAGGLEDHCEKYGPERLLFGTNYPQFNMAGPRFNLLHAGLPEEHKAAIAGGNLRRLLEEVAW